MPVASAGILPFRFADGELQVFLVHPGGPFWAGRDQGAWSIPKGEHAAGDDPLETALRELAEETGTDTAAVETKTLVELGSITQRGGKVVTAWAAELDLDAAIASNTFTLEWPPRSGRRQEFPEVDQAAWLPLPTARRKINRAQAELLTRLERALAEPSAS